MSPGVEVVRTYLELRDPAMFRPSRQVAGAEYVRRAGITPAEYRELYDGVGAAWSWRDRSAWPYEQLAAHLSRPEVVVWEMLADGQSAGFFELLRHEDGGVEIAYFGLRGAYMGRGLGGAMLTRAVEEAWRFGGDGARVWLHTCTLDAPAALPNYRARGFEPFKEERYTVELAG